MPELEASRTLVKSSPELWAECSDAASLARHLGAFGEIRITKLEPETSVAWEGDEVRGTVTLEPAGWGTRVILTAFQEPAPDGDPGPDEAPTPAGAPPASEVAPPPEGAPSSEGAPSPDAALAPGDIATPDQGASPEPLRPPGLFARLRAGWRRQRALAGLPPVVAVAPPQPPEPVRAAVPPPPSPPPPAPSAELEALTSALDSLGTPHRRPFSRA